MFLNFYRLLATDKSYKLSTVNLIPEIKFTLYFFYKFQSYCNLSTLGREIKTT